MSSSSIYWKHCRKNTQNGQLVSVLRVHFLPAPPPLLSTAYWVMNTLWMLRRPKLPTFFHRIFDKKVLKTTFWNDFWIKSYAKASEHLTFVIPRRLRCDAKSTIPYSKSVLFACIILYCSANVHFTKDMSPYTACFPLLVCCWLLLNSS